MPNLHNANAMAGFVRIVTGPKPGEMLGLDAVEPCPSRGPCECLPRCAAGW